MILSKDAASGWETLFLRLYRYVMKRRNFLFKSAVALASTAIIPSQLRTAYAIADRDLTNAITPISFDPAKDIIPAPDDPALWPAFREQLARWRDATRESLKYDDALYRKPEFAWAAKSYACYFLMMCDEAFYDPKTGQYTVESHLNSTFKPLSKKKQTSLYLHDF